MIGKRIGVVRSLKGVLVLLSVSLAAGLAGCGGSGPTTITIQGPASSNVDPGNTATFSATVANDSNSAGVTWTLTGTGCTGAGCGVLSGSSTTTVTYTAPATVGTAFTVTITASSVAKTGVVGTVTISVPVNLGITTTAGTLAGATVGTAYSVTLASVGGVAPDTWTVTTGTLPPGLSLNASTGAITGTPTAAGSVTFTVTVKDSGSPAASATQTFTIGVAAPPAITFSTTTLAGGTVGTAYSASVAATGGAGGLTYALGSGALPAGLTMSSVGAITGTPSKAGTGTFTVKATDAYGDTGVSGSLAIVVAAPPAITFSTTTLAGGTVGTAYSASVAATGGAGGLTYAVSSGSLPAGLTMSSAGAISGKPTAAATSTFTVTATDAYGDTGVSGTLSIAVVYPPVTISTTTLTNGTVGTAYSATLAASGGSGSGYTWTVTSGTGLSAVGLTLSSAGVVTGTPNAGETAGTFVVKVTDGAGNTASVTVTLTVVYPPLSITTTSLPTGIVGGAYSVQLAATGGSGTGYAYTVSAGTGLSAAGLTLSTGGLISGTPTAAENAASVTVKVTDSANNTGTATFSVTIDAALAITPATLANGTVGTAYSATLGASGGSGSGYTFAVTSGTGLSAVGLTLSSAGAVTGTPNTVETAGTFVVKVTDGAGNTGSATITLTVVYAPLTIAPTSLPNGSVGVAYSQTLTATGGSATGYTWTVTSGTLSSVGLSLSSGGVLSGSSPTAGSVSFTVKVTDSASNTQTANLSVTITTAPTVTTASLPNGTTGTAYSTTLVASGGTAPYTWSVTSGATGSNSLATLNLSVSAAGVITGTPTVAGTANFTVQVKDAANNTGTASLTITVYAPLALPATNPSTLPSATANQSYTGTITATGGSGSGYVFTVTGLPSDGLQNALNNGGSTLTIGGTPTTITTVSFTVSVRDGAGNTAGPVTYTIAVSTTYNISGQINLVSNCSGGVSLPSMTVNLMQGSTVVQTATTTSGNFSFSNVATGTYTLSPSYSGPSGSSAVFYPANPSINVSSGNVSNANFNVDLGYTVSGTVAYGGPSTGQIYLALNPTSCGGGGMPGTSISAAGAYTIRGVSPGAYTLVAFMDTLGRGNANSADPAGSSSVTVSTANYTGANVTLANAGTVTLSAGPKLSGVSGFNNGAVAQYKSITDGNGVEMATSYTLQWSTTSSFTTIAGSQTFAANGSHQDAWIVNSATNPSLSSGSIYYFRAYGTSAGTPVSPYSATAGPITIGAPTGGNTVSGSVTFTGTAAGPMYVGFLDQNTNTFYADYIPNPVSAQAYTVQVPTGSNYFFFGIIDQNKDGLIDAGDIQNTEGNNTVTAITGSTTSENLTLPTGSSTASVSTTNFQSTNSSGSSQTYSLYFQVRELAKLPVAVTLTSSTNADGANVMTPMDIASCSGGNNSCGQGFEISANLGTTAPAVGDTYTFNVAYSDGTSGPVTATVSAVLSAFATNLAPNCTSGCTSTSTTPTLTWTAPVCTGCSNYSYQFYMNDSNGNTVWQIPGNNSKSNGLPYTTTSLAWGVDPTDSTNTPSPSTLSTGMIYSWQITVQDSNNNQATQQVNYQP